MRPAFILAALACFALAACQREEPSPPHQVPPIAPFSDVPAPPPIPDVPGEHPPPSVRTYPTGEIPDDPHLALGFHVYRDNCMVCHDRGAANAPPITAVAEWKSRIAQGREILYRHAIEGFKGSRGFMPPKGGTPGSAALTDAQVRAAVDYMIHTVERLR